MPYIRPEQRQRVMETGPLNAGELNFVFTRVIIQYLETMGLNYQMINDVVGALDSAKAEFQRRVVSAYEVQKIIENGDVYPDKLQLSAPPQKQPFEEENA